MRILKSRWFTRFARRESIADLHLIEAVRRAEAGLVDADLGNGLIKQRIPRIGKGRSGGFRAVVIFRAADRAIFIYGFAKSGRDNIDTNELAGFRRLAQRLLEIDISNIGALVATGDFSEVDEDA